MAQNSIIKKIDNLLLQDYLNKSPYLIQIDMSSKYIKCYIIDDKELIVFSTLLNEGFVYPDYVSIVNTYYGMEKPQPYKLHEDVDEADYENMDKKIDFFINTLERELNFNIDLQNNEPIYFKNLTTAILKYGRKKAKKNLYLPIYLFIMEKMRQFINGRWSIFLNAIGVPPSHFLVVRDKDNKFYMLYQLEEALSSRKYFDIEFLINVSIIGYSPISRK